MTEPVTIAERTRRDVRSGSPVVESRSWGHAVIVGPDGSVAGALGDPRRPTFPRSAVKPFQATVALEVASDLAVELTDAEVAVGWASHRGEPRHLDAVRSLCRRIDLDPADLTTPEAVPEAQPELPPARLHYNCSGKHALFAAAGRALGLTGPAVIDPDGPLQQRVLAELDDVLGGLSAITVDGCGAPAVQAPLVGLAHAFQRLWVDDRYARVRRAGLAEPGMVGGDGRLDSALLTAGLIAKVGADGVYGVSWRRNGDVWGLALKVEDGDVLAASAATYGLLVAMGAVGDDAWQLPTVTGGGEPQGEVRPSDAVTALGRELGRG